jgi:hypothetical protein
MHYHLFGLNISSEIRLPCIVQKQPAIPDVEIKRGVAAIPQERRSTGPEPPSRPIYFAVEGIARFLIEAGKTVIVEAVPTADEDTMLLYLLGSALGGILHQRGLHPLHASSIETSRGAVLFCGHSGAGKSTTVSALMQRGYRMLSDDISVISGDETGALLVEAGYPQQKLWAQSLYLIPPVAARKAVPTRIGKYVVSIDDHFCEQACRLYAIYFLCPVDDVVLHLETLTGLDKVSMLSEHIYRSQFMPNQPWHFLSAVAQHSRIVRVSRPENAVDLDSFVDGLIEDMES